MGGEDERLRRQAAIAEAYHRVVTAARVEVAGITVIAASLEVAIAELEAADDAEVLRATDLGRPGGDEITVQHGA